MDEKIKTVKIAILDRIEKAVTDSEKVMSPEALKILSDIVVSFNAPNYAEIIKELNKNATKAADKDEKVEDGI